MSPGAARPSAYRPPARAARPAPPWAVAALVAVLALPCALAQGQAAATRHYAVAAGPLPQAVAQYAHAAGVALSCDAAALASLRSGGLQGECTVEAGFARLLEGSGLRAVREADGVSALRRAGPDGPPAAGDATLPTVTVSAAAAAPASATTEHS
ncbi:STN domain-containing protein [Xylophilus sp.]|uniref:STN domain-containing protein n=1 Tax=Xylophilus sp. TaxID=2653893 RepID=UPI0013BD702E|nr:STN domain-containing protein [Xylophilus sp.]KAF1049151.1 MAG: Fe(3+) dicitrate transport protein FecA [Xylophilus sp.]